MMRYDPDFGFTAAVKPNHRITEAVLNFRSCEIRTNSYDFVRILKFSYELVRNTNSHAYEFERFQTISCEFVRNLTNWKKVRRLRILAVLDHFGKIWSKLQNSYEFVRFRTKFIFCFANSYEFVRNFTKCYEFFVLFLISHKSLK